MISLIDYVGKWADSPDWTEERQQNATDMLSKVNNLLYDYQDETGNIVPINPNTRSCVSGQIYGGFRPQNCPQGAPHSSHKEGLAVDVYDPLNKLDKWLTDDILESHELYREAPQSTPSWCHLSSRSPASGKRTFIP